MCGGGGAGGSGTQRYEWNDAIAPYWANALSFGQGLTDPEKGDPNYAHYQRYPGQRIADMNSSQYAGLDRVSDIFRAGGTDASRAAGQQATDTLQGKFLGANPFAGQAVTSRDNAYAGDNPFFRQSLQSGLQDITSAYEQGTKADLDRMFTMSGTFGGDAHLKAMRNAQDALGRNLGRTANEAYQQQFDRSASLDEADIGREFQGAAMGTQLGSQAFENERGRQVGTLGFGPQDLQSQLGLGNAMVGVGDVYRGFQQDHLNMNFNDWQEMRNHPYKMLDYFSGLLGRAQGGVSPNMTFTPASYGANPFSQILGAGLLGAGLFGGQ